MKRFYSLSTLVLSILACGSTIAQDFSNKGKDFYLCFPTHVPSATLATLSIYITSDRASSGTITMLNGAFSGTFNIAANGIQEIRIPWNANIHISNTESSNENITQILTKSIHIRVDQGKPPVVAYAQQWGNARSCATLLLPTNVLGKKYYAISFTQTGSNSPPYYARSQFQVIAIKDNTTIKITPRKNGVVGNAFTITLPLAGDMIQYQSPDGAAATQDLTGTIIESVASGTGGCVPIAVFSGSSNLTMGTPGCSGSSYDPLWQQLYPVSTWGKSFGFVPFADYPAGVPYRVMASEDNTNVYFDGTLVATLNAGDIYPSAFTANPTVTFNPINIKADKPVCVAEYAQCQVCAGNGNTVGDPDMVILNPIEQNISDITIFSSTEQAITHQWVNVLMKTSGTANFRISRNGGALSPPNSAWQAFPTMPGYSYLKESLIGVSSARLVADSGFNAIAYGFGPVESYAYSAGTNVRDLYNQIGFVNPYGEATSPSVCKGIPSRFRISLPYLPDSMYWDFHGSQSPNVFVYPVVTDSTTIVNGRTVYWFSLPTPYNYNTVGSYLVTLTTYTPNTDGCGSEQDIDFNVDVYDLPIADFNFSTSGCVTSPVTFTDASNNNGRPVTKWYWDLGDGNTAITQNTIHTYAASGAYNVKHCVITDIGCKSDTLAKIVTLGDAPIANFTVSSPDCPNVSIQFTDASTVTNGTISQWSWNFGDPGSGPNNTSTLQNPTHIFATAGIYTVTLTATASGGCQSTPYIFQITIHSKPTPDFSFPLLCLPNTVQFTDQSTIIGAGESITAWSWNFGDAGTSTLQNPSHVYAGGGPYNVTLTATSNNGCSDQVTKTVNSAGSSPQPAFTAPPAACINSPVNFIDNSTVSGSTIATWNWNFGDPASGVNNTSTLQNPTHLFSGPGTYTVTLSVGSAMGCQSVNPATQQITINTLPTATISGNTTVCQNSPSPLITFTGTGGSAPYTFTYTINGGANQLVTTTSGNSVTVPVPTGTAGNFVYSLVSVQEGSFAACNQAQSGSVTVIVKTLPTATISGTTTVCLNAPSPIITFTGANGTAPYIFTYTINGGPNQVISTTVGNSVAIPISTATAGVYTYALVSVRESSGNTCSQNQTGSAVVTVNPLPTATISGTTSVCLNSTAPLLTFTGANGTAPYTFTYTINGGPNQIIATTGGSSSVTIPVPTNTLGTFTYTLVNVREGSPNGCTQPQSGSASVTVNPLPTATISGNNTVCLNSSSPLVTFTGIGGMPPYTFTYSVNGGANQFVTTTSGNSVTVPVPTNVAGTFTYTLISVQEGGGSACSQAQSGSVAITVKPLPTATISGDISVCLNASSPIVTFTGANGTAPYTFTYIINGGANQVITTSVGNSVTITVPTGTAGTYIYSLVSVQEGSANTCSQAQSGSATVIVKPLPTAIISGSTEVCLNNTPPLVTFTGANGTSPYTFVYTINGGSNQTITTTSGNSVTIPVPTGTAGTYTYSLVSVQEGSANSCSQNQSGTVAITVNPLPTANFNTSVPSCATSNITFTDASLANAGSLLKWTWDYGDGSNALLTNGNPFTHVYATAGTYNATLIVQTDKGCISTMLMKQIIVNVRPDADFVAPQVCVSDPVAPFTDASQISSGNITAWNWSFDDGGTSALQNPSHPFATPGTHSAQLIITSNQGCKDTISHSFVVNGAPTANFVVQNSNTLCSNQVVAITDGSAVTSGSLLHTEIYWDYNNDPTIKTVDNSPVIGRSYTHTYPEFRTPASKIISIRYVTYSGITCLSSFTRNITLLATPDLQFDPVTPVCSNASSFQITQVQLLNALPGAGVFSGTGVSPTGLFNPVVSGAGSFTIRYTYNATNGCSNYKEQIVTINPTPAINAGPDKVVLEGGVVQLTPALTIGGPPITFLWTPSTGLSDPTNPFTNSSPPDDITYTLTVRSDQGCMASDQVFVKVLKAPVIPNIFSPNGDGVHDKWEIAYLGTYPGCTVDIYNRYGQVIFHSVGYGTPWDGTVHGVPVPVGTYYYIVDPKNGRKLMSGYVDVIR